MRSLFCDTFAGATFVELKEEGKHEPAARELFASVLPEGWSEHTQKLRGGGQASVLYVRRVDGVEGVFRCLRDQNTNAHERFDRELKILQNPMFRHPNVVEILAASADPTCRWYISRKGRAFQSAWEKFKEANTDPEQLVLKAVKLVVALADGLTKVHQVPLVHRDIKPANIVLDYQHGLDQPILIDFGLAYDKTEERLTEPDRIAGNKRFTGDPAFLLDDPQPWLDILQLSQLLMWMTRFEPKMPHWDRPLDWRYVGYDPQLSESSILALRSVTAVCAEKSLAPDNAGDFATLLRTRFPMTTDSDPDLPVDLHRIQQGIANGKAAEDLAHADDARSIEASIAGTLGVYQKLRQVFENRRAVVEAVGLPVTCSSDVPFDEFKRSLLANSKSNATTLYELEFGESKKFHLRIHAAFYRPSLYRPELPTYPNAPSLPDTAAHICFYLQRYANLGSRVRFPSITNIVTVERDGSLVLRSERMEEVEKLDVNRIAVLVKEWTEDSSAWEAIQLQG